MTTARKLSTEIRQWLSVSSSDVDVVSSIDRELAAGGRLHGHAAVLIYRKDPLEHTRRLARALNTIEILESSESALLIQLRLPEDRFGSNRTALLRMRVDPSGHLLRIISVATPKQWNQGLEPFLDQLYPVVYRPFLRQPDLRAIFERLAEQLQEDLHLRLVKVSSLRRLLQSGSRKKYESGLTWTDLDYEEAFDDAAEKLIYFRRARFEVCEGIAGRFESLGIEGNVTRDAYFSSNSYFSWLYNAAVSTVDERAEADRSLARDRTRTTETLRADARPVVASFDSSVPLEREDVPRIAAIMRKMPKASVSILHGNPYLHASVLDFLDGSSFDVYLASDRRMMIVPRLRATESAVTRVCRFIYDQIGEASFADAESEGTATAGN